MPYERNLWDWLHEGLKPLIASRDLHICRIENKVSRGYPDIEGCFRSRSFHLELKGCLRPANQSTAVAIGLDRLQVLWLKRRWDAGGSCFVLFRVGIGRNIQRYMICGNLAQDLEGGLTEDKILQLSVIAPSADPISIIKTAALFRSLKQ